MRCDAMRMRWRMHGLCNWTVRPSIRSKRGLVRACVITQMHQKYCKIPIEDTRNNSPPLKIYVTIPRHRQAKRDHFYCITRP